MSKDYLYCPWRSEYTDSTARSKNEDTQKEECVFCTQFEKNDDTKHFIIKRGKHHVVMLNLYPYNAGHLLIVPLEHKPSLNDLSPASRIELMELINQSIEILKKDLKAQGTNVGMNIGKAAGAGIPSHLHVHVIPRWLGDTNFMPTVANTKPISFDMNEIYVLLRRGFQ